MNLGRESGVPRCPLLFSVSYTSQASPAGIATTLRDPPREQVSCLWPPQDLGHGSSRWPHRFVINDVADHDKSLLLHTNYQRQRRTLFRQRKVAFAAPPTGPNRVRQFDFFEYETADSRTWRMAGGADFSRSMSSAGTGLRPRIGTTPLPASN